MKVIRLTDYRQYKSEKARAPLGDPHYRNLATWYQWKHTGMVHYSQIVIHEWEEESRKETE